MVMKNGRHRLVGFVELGDAHDNMERLMGMYNIYNAMIKILF